MSSSTTVVQHDYPLFIDTYHNMRKKGVKFPTQYDETKVPVLTPPTVHSSSSSSSSRGTDTSSVSSTSSALAGLSPAELYHVATNVTEMFEDMLHEAQKSNSSISSQGVILELALQARELVQRMEGVIQAAVVDGSEVSVSSHVVCCSDACYLSTSRLTSVLLAVRTCRISPTTWL